MAAFISNCALQNNLILQVSLLRALRTETDLLSWLGLSKREHHTLSREAFPPPHRMDRRNARAGMMVNTDRLDMSYHTPLSSVPPMQMPTCRLG